MYSSRYSCEILMKLEYPGQVFGKEKERYSNIKFRENPCSRSRGVLCARTDGQTGRQK